MSKSDAGKGDVIRPRFISKKEWNRRWEQTFGSSSFIAYRDPGDEDPSAFESSTERNE